MKKIFISKDGSPKVYDDAVDECYHSKGGAYSESMHVFIHQGLNEILKTRTKVNLLKVGFGTGLNTWLSWQEIGKHTATVNYKSLEPFPISMQTAKEMITYFDFPQKSKEQLLRLHELEFEEEYLLSPKFTFTKSKVGIENFKDGRQVNLVYFDAFSPDKAPKLWAEAVFRNIYLQMQINGILVTYYAKGVVKRILKEVGFYVESLEGAVGKREITRAKKVENSDRTITRSAIAN